MANHGRCRKCWWRDGIYCYMHKYDTSDDNYCPNYKNRTKDKDLRDKWLKKKQEL